MFNSRTISILLLPTMGACLYNPDVPRAEAASASSTGELGQHSDTDPGTSGADDPGTSSADDPSTSTPSPTSSPPTGGASDTSPETGGASDTDNSTGEPLPDPPDAAALQLTFSQVKQFDFSWSPSAGAMYYQLLERLPEGGDFAQLGSDIVDESVSVTMPLHLRFGASYILRACNDGGCTDSDPVDVVDAVVGAVGYFKASNTGAGDSFGVSVALSTDGNTLAVSASHEDSAAAGVGGNQADNTASAAGSVYVFARTGDTWLQQAYIKASNPDADDAFGSRVTLSADGNTLAVSATYEDSAATGIGGDQADNSAEDAGAVYVFVRAGNTWSQQAYVKASNTDAHDHFGWSVALSADGNNLAVSAPYEDSAATGIGGDQADNSAEDAGAVYMFVRTGNTWAQQAQVKASNTEAHDYFGYSVALSVDADGRGTGGTLVVGALYEDSDAKGVGGDQADNSAAGSGAVYVFVRADETWSQQAYVKASNTDAGDRFGQSVALSVEDGNTLAVGASRERSAATGIDGGEDDNSLIWSGAAYVFVRVNETWSQQAYVKASNTGMGQFFGSSVALSGDGSTLVVGAHGEDSAAAGLGGDPTNSANEATEAGAVHMFVRTMNNWSQRSYIKASNTNDGDRFGWSVALSGDGHTLAVGANTEDGAAIDVSGNQANNTAADAGAVYLF